MALDIPSPASVQMIAPVARTSTVSFNRTADTNAYSAGDVLGSATGSTAAMEFTNIAPSWGGDIVITSTFLRIDAWAVPSGMGNMTLTLFSITPPSASGDNAAWDLPSVDRAYILTRIPLGTPADLGWTLWVEQHGLNRQVTAASSSLFGYLSTDGGYTPLSGTTHSVTIKAVPV